MIHWRITTVVCVVLLALLSHAVEGQTLSPSGAASGTIPNPWRASYDEMADVYSRISKDFYESVTDYMRSMIQEELKEADRRTEEMLEKHRTKEAKWRKDAIARLQSFIKRYNRYRTDPQYREHIADALFKLAELYREEAEYKMVMDGRLYEQRRREYERGIRPSPPMEAEADYSKAIELYEQIVTEFKDYRYRDMVMYLLGHYLRESHDLPKSSRVLEAMAREYPESPYAIGGLMLLGHNEYDQSNYKRAIEAYSKVASRKENNEFYEDALYRLGWASFEEFRYPEAIEAFLELLDYGEKMKGKRKERLALREEAIESIASSFYDADWDGDDLPDPDYGPERAFRYLSRGKPYEQEILKKYGDLLYDAQDEQHYRHCVVVYSKYLERFDMDPENPAVHNRLVYAYYELSQNPKVPPEEAARFSEMAQVERKRIAELYGKGSRWAEMHRYNAKALNLAAQTVSFNLLERGQFLHEQAQRVKEKFGPDAARQYYKGASEAYSKYLEQFPNSPEYVETLVRYAETQMFGLNDYASAAKVYGEIRDLDRPENTYRAEAAKAVLEARAKLVEEAANGNDPAVPIPEKLFDEHAETTIATIEQGDSKDPTKPRKVIPVEIPQVVQDWIDEVRKYLEMGFGKEDRKSSGTLSFKIGKVYFRYGHFQKAREQMEAVLKEYGDLPDLSLFCLTDIARTYQFENDLDNLEKVAQRMKEHGKSDPESVNEMLSSIKDARLKARLQRADELLEKAKKAKAAQERKEAMELFSKAANELEKIVDENPELDKADVVLLQAALSFDEVKLYDKAAMLYRRLVDEERFRKSEHREMALVNLAKNYERFFNFESAVETYSRIAKEYPNGKNAKRCLLKAAELLENDQKYTEAAAVIENFRRKYPNDESVGKLSFLLINLYEKGMEPSKAEAACKEFVTTYGRRGDLVVQVMTATIKLGRMAEGRGDKKSAQKYYKNVVNLYSSAGLKPGTKAAHLAAEAAFRLAESRVNEYKSIRLQGTSSTQRKQGLKKRAKLMELGGIYREIAKAPEEGGYGAPEWIVAAFYKIGALWKDLSESVANAPYPPDLPQDEEAKYEYHMKRGDQKAKFEDTARAVWRKGVEIARELGIQNEWTQKMLVELNKYPDDKEKYPLFRDMKQFKSEEPILQFQFVE